MGEKEREVREDNREEIGEKVSLTLSQWGLSQFEKWVILIEREEGERRREGGKRFQDLFIWTQSLLSYIKICIVPYCIQFNTIYY